MAEKTTEEGLPLQELHRYNDNSATASRRSVGWRRLFGLLMLTITCVTLSFVQSPGLSTLSKHSRSRHRPVNVVLMISDGYGPASHTMTRSFYQALHRNDSVPSRGWGFPLDSSLVGSHRSRSSSSLITDSAAGATAFACGKKSYNGGIGVDEEGVSCGNVFEAAKTRDYLTGVVVTSRLTDATPACFFAHAGSRSEESFIASQMLASPYKGGKRTIDLAIGGGGCYFLPQSNPLSCRSDDRDLVSEAEDDGWDVRLGASMLDRDHVQQAPLSKSPHGERITRAYDAPTARLNSSEHASKPRLPYLGLLSPSNTPYVIDAALAEQQQIPSLAQLSEQALRALADGARSKSRRSKKTGFMLMIEGSQIDLCQHQNDPACMVREAVAYQEAAGKVKSMVDDLNARGEPTILISTSDHETGGLTLGRQLTPGYPDYLYYPERLVNVEASAEHLSARLFRFYRSSTTPGEQELADFVTSRILGTDGGLNFGPDESGGRVTPEEVQEVLSCLPHHQIGEIFDDPPIDNTDDCRKRIADVASKRARVGWSSSGHTGVDINVYAHGHGSEGLHGNIENTDIGLFIADLLNLDLDRITHKLRHNEPQSFS